jgi:hypothetical protein
VEAVSTQVWSGAAQVHVSIVSWVKGDSPGVKALRWQEGDTKGSPWRAKEVDRINAALSPNTDVTAARSLRVNAASNACFQGQTHGHEAFLLAPDAAREMRGASSRNADVLFPFLIAEELLGAQAGAPRRYVIDFGQMDERSARLYKEPFARVEAGLPLLTITDLSRVRVEADLQEYEAAGVAAGQPATLTLTYDPGPPIPMRVDTVYPILNGETRTLKVRFLVDNAGLRLKPGLFATVELPVQSATGVRVPESAVMDTGTRRLVFVAACRPGGAARGGSGADHRRAQRG